jgi:hypothetical protein
MEATKDERRLLKLLKLLEREIQGEFNHSTNVQRATIQIQRKALDF